VTLTLDRTRQPATKGNLDLYMRGVPQTDELAALQRGEEPQAAAAEVAETAKATAFPHSEITDEDCEHLLSLKLHAGWAVLLKLLDKNIREQEHRAIAISEDDPLLNRDKIASNWANVSALKRMRNLAVALVDAEIAKLEERKSDQ
jgi:hypothetical protein